MSYKLLVSNIFSTLCKKFGKLIHLNPFPHKYQNGLVFACWVFKQNIFTYMTKANIFATKRKKCFPQHLTTYSPLPKKTQYILHPWHLYLPPPPALLFLPAMFLQRMGFPSYHLHSAERYDVKRTHSNGQFIMSKSERESEIFLWSLFPLDVNNKLDFLRTHWETTSFCIRCRSM